jgi:lysyl-tRNA synthetase class II
MKMLVVALLLAGPATAQSVQERLNDYPTAARADYVFGCMAANGQSRAALEKCSCSIDRIASILPYEKYVEAETVLSLRQTGGERLAIFRTAPIAKILVADLRRAQAEAEIRCF